MSYSIWTLFCFSSQSVPVHELLDTVPDISFVLNPQQSTTDFTIPTATDPLCAPNLFGMNAANEYGIQLIDNNMAVQEFDTQAAEEVRSKSLMLVFVK